MTDREALIRAIELEQENDHDYDPEYDGRPDAQRYADAILAAGFSRSPLPVEGEVEWETAVFTQEHGVLRITAWESIEEARRTFPDITYVEQRRKVLGPWEEVTPVNAADPRAEAERYANWLFMGRADDVRKFIAGAQWQASRPFTEEDVEAAREGIRVEWAANRGDPGDDSLARAALDAVTARHND